MKQKSLFIVLGIVAAVVGGYFLIIRPAKFRSQNPEKNERKILINGKPA
jgi:hypothetical protein